MHLFNWILSEFMRRHTRSSTWSMQQTHLHTVNGSIGSIVKNLKPANWIETKTRRRKKLSINDCLHVHALFLFIHSFVRCKFFSSVFASCFIIHSSFFLFQHIAVHCILYVQIAIHFKCLHVCVRVFVNVLFGEMANEYDRHSENEHRTKSNQ